MKRSATIFDFLAICMAVTTGVLMAGCATDEPGLAGDDGERAMLSGDAPETVVQIALNLTPLSNAELSRIFRDVAVTNEMSNSGEFFRSDGTYRVQGRTMNDGQYWISGPEVCIQVPNMTDPYCRAFARGSDDQIYLVSSRRDGESRPVDPIKYSFKPL